VFSPPTSSESAYEIYEEERRLCEDLGAAADSGNFLEERRTVFYYLVARVLLEELIPLGDYSSFVSAGSAVFWKVAGCY